MCRSILWYSCCPYTFNATHPKLSTVEKNLKGKKKKTHKKKNKKNYTHAKPKQPQTPIEMLHFNTVY